MGAPERRQCSGLAVTSAPPARSRSSAVEATSVADDDGPRRAAVRASRGHTNPNCHRDGSLGGCMVVVAAVAGSISWTGWRLRSALVHGWLHMAAWWWWRAHVLVHPYMYLLLDLK